MFSEKCSGCQPRVHRRIFGGPWPLHTSDESKIARCIGVGKGGKASPGFRKFQQKKLFSISRGKTKFHYFWPPLKKFWKKTLVAPPWKKSFRRPRRDAKLRAKLVSLAKDKFSETSIQSCQIQIDQKCQITYPNMPNRLNKAKQADGCRFSNTLMSNDRKVMFLRNLSLELLYTENSFW